MGLRERIFGKSMPDGDKSGNNVSGIRHCCMCGAPETDVNIIIGGANNHYLCDRCAVMIHHDMQSLYDYSLNVQKEQEAQNNPILVDEDGDPVVAIPTPHEIKEFLDQYVIGQDFAKMKLSVAVYNHYKRIYQPPTDVEIEKSNILLCGESGTGKTILAKSVAKMLEVPIVVVDSTCFTQAGYVGEDVESIISRLYQEAGGDVEKTQKGIVVLDEIDKLARKGDNPSITRDVSGEGVQQSMLKLLEGSKVMISPDGGRKHPEKPCVEIDTKDILFICAGAFEGMAQKIEKRMDVHSVGFDATAASSEYDKSNYMRYITPDDLKSFGMIPELVGRVPVVATTDPLTKDTLRSILTEPKNAIIKQFVKSFEMDGIKLTFEPGTLDFIVEKAIETKLGARGLRTIVEEIMTDYMYDMPSTNRKTLKVTRKYAEGVYEKKAKLISAFNEVKNTDC